MTYRLDMSPDQAEVDRVVPLLIAELSGALSEDRLMSVEIAMAEALTNAVKHALASGTPDVIHVSAQSDARQVRLEIVDAGAQSPQDLYQDVAELGDIDPMNDSGRGLSLISHLADEVVFNPAHGKNQLILIFNRDNTA